MSGSPGKLPGLVVLVLLLASSALGQGVQEPEYIGLQSISDDLGLEFDRSDDGRTVRLSGQWVVLEFVVASRISVLNGIKIFLGDPVLESGGRVYLARDDWNLALKPILMPRSFPNPPGYRKVVIDAGHGGDDPGGLNQALGLKEKDMTLILSKAIGERLTREGFEVSYTRSEDKFIPLATRPALANRAGADIFLSIHFNAAAESVRGVETFVYTLLGDPSSSRSRLEPVDRQSHPGNQNDPWNSLLGFYLQSEVAAETGLPNRGLKRARFSVLEDLSSPGALLELGFISNPQTGRLLMDPAFRDRLADSVVRGVLRYRKALMRLHAEPAQ